MTVPGQSQVVYTYDNANRLTQIVQGSATVSYGYDLAGRRTSMTLPNAVLVQYGYDVASRLTSITYKQNGTTVLGDLTYEYDKAGQRTKVGGSFARTGIPQTVNTTNYNAANHQLVFGDKTMTFDNNGNLQTITDNAGTTTYTWNSRNQLTGISGPVSASFYYDGLGRREKKIVNGAITEFLYDGLNPVQETNGTPVTANLLTGLGLDEFLTRTDNGTGLTSAFLTDALGSAVASTNASGTVQTEYSYEPFGKVNTTGTTNNSSYQFTGRENDGTSVNYYRARYYEPGLQRFISEDPIGFASGDVNFYAYVRNDPIQFVDPSGLLASPWHAFSSFVAMKLSGYNNFESAVVAAASAGWDIGTQGPEYANSHAIREPKQSLEKAVEGYNQFVRENLAAGNLVNLGFANHAVEDRPRHKFEEFMEMDFTNGKYLWHLFRDFTPSPFEIIEAIRGDLENIAAYECVKKSMKLNRGCKPRL